MQDFEIPAFAKINLILRITGLRRDGYHSLETVFQTLDLHDTLAFHFTPSNFFHVSLDVQDGQIPADGTNLIYRACKAFHEAHALKHRVEVSIRKRIPIESGLGGGSSNAAATLLALSRLYGYPLSRRQLLPIARSLGADVPFFLYGGTGFGTARGDQIKPLQDWFPETPLLLVTPAVSCSTAVIYRNFDEAGLLTAGRNSIKILLNRRRESLRDFVPKFENDLERVVFSLYPELDSIKKRLKETGAIVALLTGSGSALFGLFADAAERDRALGAFPASIATRFVSRQEYLERLGLPDRWKRIPAGG